MGFKTLDEIKAYRAALAFKLEVYEILESSPSAQRDFDFLNQIRDAASGGEMNIAEGFGRFLAGDFIKFLRIGRGCLDEIMKWLDDGVARKHYSDERGQRARELGVEARRLTTALIRSLLPFIRKPSRWSTKRRKNTAREDSRGTEDRGLGTDLGWTGDSGRTRD